MGLGRASEPGEAFDRSATGGGERLGRDPAGRESRARRIRPSSPGGGSALMGSAAGPRRRSRRRRPAAERRRRSRRPIVRAGIRRVVGRLVVGRHVGIVVAVVEALVDVVDLLEAVVDVPEVIVHDCCRGQGAVADRAPGGLLRERRRGVIRRVARSMSPDEDAAGNRARSRPTRSSPSGSRRTSSCRHAASRARTGWRRTR